MRMRAAGVVLVAGVMLLASGCKSIGSCNKAAAYATAEEIPSLKVPAGLDGPDIRQALQIPALTEPETPRAKGDPCLEEPPALQKAPARPAAAAPAG